MMKRTLVAGAALSAVVGSARADYFTTNFLNDTGVTVYDWHLVLLAPTSGTTVITMVTGGPLAGGVQRNWTGSTVVGGTEANLVAPAGDPGLPAGSQMGAGLTFTGGSIQSGVWDWYWTDANHNQVGETHHYPAPAPGSVALLGLGMGLMVKRRRRAGP